MKRADGRAWDELRPVRIIPGYQSFAEGSVLIELGKTRVLCSVSVEERVPAFLKGEGGGWITADALFGQIPADVTHLRFSSGAQSLGIDIMTIIGKVNLQVIE